MRSSKLESGSRDIVTSSQSFYRVLWNILVGVGKTLASQPYRSERAIAVSPISTSQTRPDLVASHRKEWAIAFPTQSLHYTYLTTHKDASYYDLNLKFQILFLTISFQSIGAKKPRTPI
jgi:hypothetical protein